MGHFVEHAVRGAFARDPCVWVLLSVFIWACVFVRVRNPVASMPHGLRLLLVVFCFCLLFVFLFSFCCVFVFVFVFVFFFRFDSRIRFSIFPYFSLFPAGFIVKGKG